MAKSKRSAQAQEIEKLMKTLDLTKEEAKELADFDAGKFDHPEVEAIEKKIEGSRQEKRSPLEKVRHSKAKKKVDEEKSTIIDSIFGFIKSSAALVNPQVITSTKMSFKGASGAYYSVTITKHKHKPDGYKEQI